MTIREEQCDKFAFLGYESACEALRFITGREKRWPPTERILPIWGACVSSQRDFVQFESKTDLAAYGVTSKPVDLLVASAQMRRFGKRATFHVWKHVVPKKSMIRLESNLIASGPELVIIQMSGYQLKSGPLIDKFVEQLHNDEDAIIAAGSGELPLYDDPRIWERIVRLVRMAMLTMEFCGTYRLPCGGRPTTYGAPRLMTLESLRAVRNEVPTAFGSKRLEGVLSIAMERSASPMETGMSLLLTMPVEMGGFGLPKPLLNWSKDVRGNEFVHPGRKELTPDMLWDAACVAVEYDSDENHALAPREQAMVDAMRANALTAMGYSVLRITTGMARSLAEMTLFARQLASKLHVDLAEPTLLEMLRRRRLHELLLGR